MMFSVGPFCKIPSGRQVSFGCGLRFHASKMRARAKHFNPERRPKNVPSPRIFVGIAWALCNVDADVTPNPEKVTPPCADLPPRQ